MVGIPREEVNTLEHQFAARGIRALELTPRIGHPWPRNPGDREDRERLRRIGSDRRSGAFRSGNSRRREISASTEAQLLLDFPGLRAEDLVNAWSFARDHRDEIEAEIRENEDA